MAPSRFYALILDSPNYVMFYSIVGPKIDYPSEPNLITSVFCVLSCVRLFERPWTVALQAPLSMEFPRQKYWSGLPFPPLGDCLDPRIKPVSLAWSLYH